MAPLLSRFWPEAAIGFAENYAKRIAALRAEAAIGPTELCIAASDPLRSFRLSSRPTPPLMPYSYTHIINVYLRPWFSFLSHLRGVQA